MTPAFTAAILMFRRTTDDYYLEGEATTKTEKPDREITAKMHLFIFLTVMVAELTASGLARTAYPRASTTSLAMPFARDIDVHPISEAGAPVPERKAIMFLHVLQLDFYRETLRQDFREVVVPEQLWERDFSNLVLQLRPFHHSGMTWAEAFLAMQSLLRVMLYPQFSEGFRERRWSIRRRLSQSWVDMGEIYFALKSPGSLLGIASNFSPSSTTNTSDISSPSAVPASLSASFPVPETDLTLLIGSRGVDLPRAPLIQATDGLMIKAFRDVIINHGVQTMNEISGEVEDESGWTSIRLRPRMRGNTSLFTNTDMMEMAVGVVYYMVNNGFFATTITAVRADRRGKRSPVGSMEFSIQRFPNISVGSGNMSLIETS